MLYDISITATSSYLTFIYCQRPVKWENVKGLSEYELGRSFKKDFFRKVISICQKIHLFADKEILNSVLWNYHVKNHSGKE